MSVTLKYHLRSLRVRKVAAILTALGIALVTVIFVSLLAMGQGLRRTMSSTGHPKNLIVLRDGPTAETQSSIEKTVYNDLRSVPGIARDASGEPMTSPETIVIVSAVKEDGGHANIMLRGVTPMAYVVRPDLHIEGRWPRPGSAEAVVGATLARRVPSLAIGARPRFKTVEYEVVGLFDAQGRAYDSEVWVDLNILMPEFGRPYSSAVVRADDAAALAAAIDADPRLKLKGHPEAEYYRRQTQSAEMIEGMAMTVAIVLGIGACFGAAITMYAAVAARVREVATLRVLGFSPWGIWGGFLLEAAAIALAGGVVGSLLALPVNRLTIGTINFVTFTEVAFNFAVTPALMGAGALMATLLGVAGGLFPAVRAARIPVARALREL